MTLALELDALVSLERIQTIVVGGPPIVLRLGPRGDDGRDTSQIGVPRWQVVRLDRDAFALVFGVYAKGAHDSASGALFLPDLVAGAGRDIVAICLIDFGLLAARKVLDRVRNCGPVIGAMRVAIDPPFEVDYSGFLTGADVSMVFGLGNMSLDG